AELKGKTEEFRKRLADGEGLEDLMPEAFACVREAARRTIGQRHFDVQVMGATVLHRGDIAEMKTGEGKTLVSTMPGYVNALEDMVQRGHHFAIVDEVDSILIDEARTPLIISGMASESAKWYMTFARIAPRLRPETDYEVDEQKRTVSVTEAGVAKVEEFLGV